VKGHALTIDLEEWFQVLNLRALVPPARWDRMERRTPAATAGLLALLADHGVKATFFCLGWLAEREPELIRRIEGEGHEIASHGYGHCRLHELGREGFRQDLERSVTLLEEITGRRPTGFRACSFSITPGTAWGLEEVARLGFTYDSSVFPVRHPDYGWPSFAPGPGFVETGAGRLLEFPPLTAGLGRWRLPLGGGGYLRLLPARLLSGRLGRLERRGLPGCIYLHPWELDPDQPRPGLRGLKAFRHYLNLARTERKLRYLLERHPFRPMGRIAAAWPGA